jgi:hypothetical protein
MKLKIKFLIAACVVLLSTQAGQAATDDNLSPWSIRLGARAFLFMTVSEHLEVSYRLADPRWEAFLGGSFSALRTYAGARFYFNPENELLNYFVLARAGVRLFDGRSEIIQGGAPVGTIGGWEVSPELALGLGLDWNINPHLGLTAGIYGGTPYYFYPEIAAKYRF